MSETSEIIREARKAGMQTAIMLFAALVLVLIAFCGLFGYYIYKSYEPQITTSRITQTQDGTNNKQEMINGETKSNI